MLSWIFPNAFLCVSLSRAPRVDIRLCLYELVCAQIAWALIRKAYPGGPHERTPLIILGDHGQTMNGDHGGGTPEEVDSALLMVRLGTAHSAAVAAGLLPAPEEPCAPRTRAGGGVLEDRVACRMPERAAARGREVPMHEVPQLDFAASLATLLGVPIPYGNVGAALLGGCTA